MGSASLRERGNSLKVLNENADDGIGKDKRAIFIFGAQAAAGVADGGFHGGESWRHWFLPPKEYDGSRRQLFHGEAIKGTITRFQRAAAMRVGADFDGQRRMRGGIEPARDFAHKGALVDTLPKGAGATQRRSPY